MRIDVERFLTITAMLAAGTAVALGCSSEDVENNPKNDGGISGASGRGGSSGARRDARARAAAREARAVRARLVRREPGARAERPMPRRTRGGHRWHRGRRRKRLFGRHVAQPTLARNLVTTCPTPAVDVRQRTSRRSLPVRVHGRERSRRSFRGAQDLSEYCQQRRSCLLHGSRQRGPGVH